MDENQDEGRSTGTDARNAVAAVLQDQADRARRRDAPSRPPRRRGVMPTVLLLVLVGATAWVLVAPPAFLTPPPLPSPTPEELEAGLRMDLWIAARSVNRYRDAHGSLPATLVEAMEAPEDARDLRYEPLTGGRYRLTGVRDTVVVVWESTEPLERLTGPALPVVGSES